MFSVAAVIYGIINERIIEIEAQNNKNEAAIMRLLDEMGALADGDLTAHATVTEDITGAIADSINYTIDALRNMTTNLRSGGVFAIWSNEPESAEFSDHLATLFSQVKNHLIEFPNPYTGGVSHNSVYLATKP